MRPSIDGRKGNAILQEPAWLDAGIHRQPSLHLGDIQIDRFGPQSRWNDRRALDDQDGLRRIIVDLGCASGPVEGISVPGPTIM